jgi:hypothetical protein
MSTSQKWNQDLELSNKFKPVQDKIYRYEYRDLVSITRETQEQMHDISQKFSLDKDLHIDAIITTKENQILYQEKVLRNKYLKYGTFTMEYENNRFTHEKGEFFSIVAQWYLHGYANIDETDYEVCKIICIPAFLMWYDRCYCNKRVIAIDNEGDDSKGSFIAVPYSCIPEYICFTPKLYQ